MVLATHVDTGVLLHQVTIVYNIILVVLLKGVQGSQDVTTQQAIDDAKAFAEACIAEWALYDLPCIIDSTKSPQNQRIEVLFAFLLCIQLKRQCNI